MPSLLIRCLPALLAVGAVAASGKDAPARLDALTEQLLRRPEFEKVVISPDGTRLAIARRFADRTMVSISDRESLAVQFNIDPGAAGEIDSIQWLDDRRLIVAADHADSLYGSPQNDSSLHLVDVTTREDFQLPANFVSAIEGDPNHLLVLVCQHWVDAYCVPDVLRVEFHKNRKPGELVVRAPEAHSTMLANRSGDVPFAISRAKDGTSKTWVRSPSAPNWALINDESKSSLEVNPLGISRDGKFGFLRSERVDGTDVVERYDFATGLRTDLLRDAVSDPLDILYSLDGNEPIGAVYNATRPQLRFWNDNHPDAISLIGLQKTFPGKLVSLLSASRDGRYAVVYTEGDHDLGTFYVLDRQTHQASLLTARAPWLDALPLGSQREISFSARDGLLLHGLLTVPPASSGKNLPMIVLPHGGPYWVFDRWGYDLEAQILASHGYAVLQTNFRGSGSYGKAFEERGMRQWGKAMQDDLTDATHWAVAQGIADPARMCIYGSSYGGYAALMGVIREPELYRCAVGYAGVYDLNKMYRWQNTRETELGLDYLHRAIGTDKADLAANSPALHADKIKVPVLLAHGHQDETVSVQFAYAMKKALNKNGQKAELIEYPYQGHGLFREDQRRDFYARLLAFLRSNLGVAEIAGATKSE